MEGQGATMNVMEVAGVPGMINRAFGGDFVTRGRVFLCCVTGEEVMVLTDGRRDGSGGAASFHNVLVPTVCGRCDKDREGKQRVGRGMELSRGLIKEWRVCKMVQAWCTGEVEVVVKVAEREEVMKEIRGYRVRMQGSRTTRQELEVVQYVDAGFL